MKRSEVKIGDIVSYNGTVAPIYDLARDVVRFDEGSVSALIKDISPVPLTEEILEKNGWEKVDWCFIKNFLTLVPHENKTKGFSFSVYGGKSRYNIKYIHQLQHILWALGMDDDLKI